MTRFSAFAAVALLAFTATGCDRTESLSLTPELEEETTFESGLNGWFVDRQTGSLGTGAVVSGGMGGLGGIGKQLGDGACRRHVHRVHADSSALHEVLNPHAAPTT